jgi:hypothetical protein
MVDMTDSSSAGVSVWERELAAHLTEHLQAERVLLDQYSAIGQNTQSKAFRYLVNLLVEDEIRHHRLFTQLADSLETSASLTGEDPAIPYLDLHRGEQDAILSATRQLMDNEEQDSRELKRLRRQLRDVKDTTLWDLLVELMERDTEEHIAILRFVSKHAGRSR